MLYNSLDALLQKRGKTDKKNIYNNFKKPLDKTRFVLYNKATKKETTNNNRQKKGQKIMRYRAYNEQNICERTGITFATYFRTKKEAIAHAQKIGGNARVERKVGDLWIAC